MRYAFGLGCRVSRLKEKKIDNNNNNSKEKKKRERERGKESRKGEKGENKRRRVKRKGEIKRAITSEDLNTDINKSAVNCYAMCSYMEHVAGN